MALHINLLKKLMFDPNKINRNLQKYNPQFIQNINQNKVQLIKLNFNFSPIT